MKKITIDCRMIEHSGLGRYLQNIVPRLITSEANKFFYIIGPVEKLHKYLPKDDKNFKIINCNLPIFSVKSQLLINKYIPRNTDLLWVPHFNVPFFYRGKMVVTIHDMLQFAYPEYSGSKLKCLAAKAYFWFAKNKAEAVITVSEFSKREIKKFLNLDKNVHAVYNGIDEKWFKVEKESKFKNKKYFLYVGNVKKHKNIELFLQSMCEIQKEFDVKAIVVGRKEGLRTPDNNLEKYIKMMGEKLEFTGFVTEKELEQYYANASAFVFPSKYEGFGFPVLEAMAIGCPVLSSNAASLPEICREYALYFDPNEKNRLVEIIKLVIDNKYPIDIADAKDFARKYTWEQCVMNTRRILDGVIG